MTEFFNSLIGFAILVGIACLFGFQPGAFLLWLAANWIAVLVVSFIVIGFLGSRY